MSWVVPVAFKLVKLPVPEFRTEMLAIVAIRLPIVAVMAERIELDSVPVTVSFETVVEPSVDEPETESVPAVEMLPAAVMVALPPKVD